MRRNGDIGTDELADAARAVGLVPEIPPADAEFDLVLSHPAGGRFAVEVKRVSLASVDRLSHQTDRPDAATDSAIRVIVADRVTEQAREVLRAAGRSWLDLRGHLHLVGDGLFVDATVPALGVTAERPAPLAGHVGQEVAALMLLDPGRPASVRELARQLRRSASSVSAATGGMRAAGLVDDERRPVVPDLFWVLAERWRPVEIAVRRLPTSTDPIVQATLKLGLDHVAATTGWALTDTMAAASYGAPVGTRADYPQDFFVPDQATMRRAAQVLGTASSRDTRAATIRVAPTSLVCGRRLSWPGQAWPMARPLFVALDLARDPGRGREVLEGWTPPPEVGSRVW